MRLGNCSWAEYFDSTGPTWRRGRAPARPWLPASPGCPRLHPPTSLRSVDPFGEAMFSSSRTARTPRKASPGFSNWEPSSNAVSRWRCSSVTSCAGSRGGRASPDRPRPPVDDSPRRGRQGRRHSIPRPNGTRARRGSARRREAYSRRTVPRTPSAAPPDDSRRHTPWPHRLQPSPPIGHPPPAAEGGGRGRGRVSGRQIPHQHSGVSGRDGEAPTVRREGEDGIVRRQQMVGHILAVRSRAETASQR